MRKDRAHCPFQFAAGAFDRSAPTIHEPAEVPGKGSNRKLEFMRVVRFRPGSIPWLLPSDQHDSEASFVSHHPSVSFGSLSQPRRSLFTGFDPSERTASDQSFGIAKVGPVGQWRLAKCGAFC